MSRRFDDEEPDEQQEMVDAIKSSPVVAHCSECGREIRQAEIDFGTASSDECSACVYSAVMLDH